MNFNENALLMLIAGLGALNEKPGTTIPTSCEIINLNNMLQRVLREVRAEAEKLKEVPKEEAKEEVANNG